ncbi:MAG TPA: translocation/assembly module TamB domain-containing protein [Casimicrobiaceae bacterium]|nr:translocation/assembly module TamB domain-containing protein [Casimicrobiaceae bacterium]
MLPAIRRASTALSIAFLLIVAIVGGALWFAASDAGLRWASGEATARSGGRLTIEGATGSLGGTVRIARLRYEDEDLRLVADDVAFTWSPRALFSRTVLVDTLSAAAVTLEFKPSAGPSAPPASLALPWPIDVRRADIAALAVSSGPNRWRVTQLGFHYTGAIERHTLDALALDSEWGSLRGKLAIGAMPPFAAEGRIVFAGSEAARHAIATVVVGGDMTTLSLSGDGSVDDARATGAARIAPFEARRLRDFELRVENVDLARFDAALPRTELQATLAGTGRDDGGVRGALTARNAIAGPWSAGRLPLVSMASGFAADGEGVQLDELDAALGDAGRVTGAAGIDRGAATWRLAVRDLDLHRIVADLKPTRLAGAFAGRMRVDTADADGEISGDLRQSDMALAFRATVARGVIDVSTFRAQARGGTLQGTASVAMAGTRAFRLNATATTLNPASFGNYPVASLSGTANAQGALKPVWSAAISFELGRDSTLRGRPLAGTGKFAVAPGSIRDAHVALTAGANALSLNGDFGRAGDVLGFAMDVRDPATLDARLGGRLHADGKIAGTWERPTIAFTAAGDHLRVGAEFAAATLEVDGEIGAGADRPLRLVLAATAAHTEAITLRTLRADVGGTLAHHQAKIDAAGNAADADFELITRLEGGWTGDASTGSWTGRIASLESRGKYPMMLAQPAELEAGTRRIRLANVRGTLAGGRFAVDELRWQDARLSSRGDFSALPAAPLLAFAGVAPRVSSTLTLAGRWSFAAAPRITGTLSMSRDGGDLAPVGSPEFALGLTRAELVAEFVDDRVHATAVARSRLADADFTADLAPAPQAAARFGAGAPLTLSARVNVASLRALQGIAGTTAVIDGRLKLDLVGHGTLDSVRFSGTVEGDALKLEAAQYGIALKDGYLRARLTEQTISVSEFSFAAGEGRFVASGTLPASRDIDGARLAWKADKLALFNRPDTKLTLTGEGTLLFQRGGVTLAGALKADEGYFDFHPGGTDVPGDDVIVRGREKRPSRDITQRVPFGVDLDLDFGENLRFVGEGFDTGLAGKLHVKTNNARDLVANGTIDLVRGTYTTFGQRLVIQRGRLFFNGPLDNPGLDVFALRKNLPVEAGVEVTGSARVPQVQLTSNPPVPDNEKLAWLVLGHGLDSTSSADAALLQAALGALSGPGSTPFGQRIAQTIGVDEISVRSSADPQRTGTAGQVVAFSKRLSDKLTLVYEQGTSVANNAIKLEYSLTRALTLRVEAGVVSGIGFYYSRSYD